MPRRLGLLLILAGPALNASCGGDDESLTGVWTGAVRDSLAGSGGVTLTLFQSGSDLEGTWEMVFASTSHLDAGGTLTGTVQGSLISATLASRGACNYSLTATSSGDRIQGTYAAGDCPPQHTGSLDLDRR
jgi:hypothetical protein